MKIKALAFVGTPVTDMQRARSFYEGVLGLTVCEEMMSGRWIEYALGDNTLAIASVGPEWLPSDHGTGAALEVEDFDKAIEWLKHRKVHFSTEPHETPCCHMAIIKDRDGNNIVIHKLKPENEKEPCLMIKEVAFVAIAVSDPERARKFYQETLELKPTSTQMEGAWVEYDIGPTTIGVGCHPAWQPSRDGTTVAFEVDDIDATIEKLKSRGVTFDLPKTETPVCWMAQFRDPDGNKLVVHKRKQK